jgi:hypothetical protein
VRLLLALSLDVLHHTAVYGVDFDVAVSVLHDAVVHYGRDGAPYSALHTPTPAVPSGRPRAPAEDREHADALSLAFLVPTMAGAVFESACGMDGRKLTSIL